MARKRGRSNNSLSRYGYKPHRRRLNLWERFWSRAHEREDGCWIWDGTVDRLGYGWISYESRLRLVHRYAYEMLVEPIPDGMSIDHLCRNRDCVNPAHMEVVTHKENVHRGVGPTAINAAKTHCKRGHEFTEANTYIIPSTGSRVCKVCRNEYARRRHGQAAA